MRLHFLIVRRVPPVPSPVLVEAYDILRQRGYDVSESIAEEVLTRPDCVTPEHDLYILKSHTELSLSLAGALHTQGAWLLNPYISCALTQNKIVVSRLLSDAGVRAPRSWVTEDYSLLREVLAETPLIVKPYLGHRGAGITIVRTEEELLALPKPTVPMIVQELVVGDGEDTKVYCVRDEVFAVRKVFSESSFTQVGRPVPVSDEVKRMANTVGRVCGLSLFGLDVIESENGPYVVDVNFFPGYKGVPDVAPLIADAIDDYAQGRYTLEPGGRAATATRTEP
jgi:ribosomal protein S6--L-glutamate ligase